MLGEVARVFLTLGVIGFGGPAAHITLMREEISGSLPEAVDAGS